MIRELNRLIEKQIRKSQKTDGHKKIVKVKKQNMETTKLKDLSF